MATVDHHSNNHRHSDSQATIREWEDMKISRRRLATARVRVLSGCLREDPRQVPREGEVDLLCSSGRLRALEATHLHSATCKRLNPPARQYTHLWIGLRSRHKTSHLPAMALISTYS